MTLPSAPFDFRMLGPLEVWERGARVEIRGARARALLAVLLLNAGRSMVVGQLVEALWNGRPPRTARDSVQFFVHQIRRGLGPDAGTRLLRTTTSGYVLQIEPEQLDTERFQRLLGQARAAVADGALEHAWACYADALSLWRGGALQDFADEAFAQPEIARLEELRLTATEERLRTGIELGRHAEVIGDAEMLVRDQPLREQARALLMLALCRAGRQTDALQVYQAGRAASVEQLGIEPGPELVMLERAIVAGGPALLEPHAAPATVATPGPAATAAPARLPAPADHADPVPHPDRGIPPVVPPVVPPADAAPRDERKLVTVLVASVAEADSGGDPEDVRGHTTAALDRITERVAHYGGAVQAAAMGRLLAVFGAARSQEDDPERAVRVGLEICAAPTASGPTARIGIATGDVVVSTATPSPTPGETGAASVVGDVIHAATALSIAAPPGTVRVGAGTYRTTGRAIEYRRVEPTDPSQQALEQLTGAQVWEAVQPRGRTSAQVTDRVASPLVERDRALGLLTDVLNRFLRDDEPQLLTLISDPGLGKSRLVAELAQLTDQASTLVNWRVGQSFAYGEGTFWALAQIVKNHADVLADDPAGVADDKLRTVVSSAVAEPEQAAAVLESLRALLGPAAPRERTPELFPRWYEFFAALAIQRPTVLVFEDLQWADDSLLEFVAGLAEHVGPVPLLVVATGRPELLDRRAAWAGGQRNAVSLSLTPLSRAGTATLLDALLPGQTLPDEPREALLTSAGGNPLYVEEYVRMLQERPSATLGDELPVPPTVQQLIAARLDSLPGEDKRLLQDAAVIGEVGWVGALATASRRDAAEVLAAVRRLELRGLLRRARVPSVGGETEYAFRHALVRDVAYSQLLRGERSAQHLRVAEWIAHLNPDPGERTEMLAHHYERALRLAQAGGTASPDLTERTRQVLRAAGDRARGLGALPSAERWYAAALELCPSEDSERPELLFQLGMVQSWSRHQGKVALTAARDAFVRSGDRRRAARAAVQLAYLARNSGNPGEVEAHLEDALALDPDDRAGRVVAMAGQVLELSIREHVVEAIELGKDIAQSAAALGLPEEEAFALSGLGHARLKSGDVQGAKDYERAISLLDQAHNPAVHFARWALARCLWVLGDLAWSATVAAEGRRLAETSGDATGDVLQWFDALLTVVDYGAGRWDAVVGFVDRALDGAGDRRNYPEPWYRPGRCRVRLGRGDLTGALEDATQSLAVSQLVGEASMLQPCRALHARALIAAGQDAEAANLVDLLLSDQRLNPPEATVTPDQAFAMIQLGNLSTLPDGLRPTRWHQAARLLVTRDFDGAARTLDEIGAAADAATTRMLQARVLADEGRAEDAQAELDQAVAFWRRAGANACLAEAEALAATLTTPPVAPEGRG